MAYRIAIIITGDVTVFIQMVIKFCTTHSTTLVENKHGMSKIERLQAMEAIWDSLLH